MRMSTLGVNNDEISTLTNVEVLAAVSDLAKQEYRSAGTVLEPGDVPGDLLL